MKMCSESTAALEAVEISSWVRDLLQGCDKAAHVHSVFQRVINCVDDSGNLIALLDKRVSRVPFGIGVEIRANHGFERFNIRAGQSVAITSDSIRFPESGIRITLDQATVFSSECRLHRVDNDPQKLAARLLSAASVIEKSNTKGGLLPLLPFLEDLLKGETVHDLFLSPLCSRGKNGIVHLLDGIKNRCMDTALQGVLGLSGLGIGLTPSGDDVLTGFFGTLVLLEEFDFSNPWFPGLFRAAKAMVRGRTTMIADAYLAHAMQGRISERLFELIEAIAAGSCLDVDGAAARIKEVGHTSGCEMCMGVLLAFGIHHKCLLENASAVV
jgi:hypothetical protein